MNDFFLNLLSPIGNIFFSLAPFIILLSILVFIHELGHFLVARFCGVRVEVFSLGFGKKLLKWKRKDTTYCISLLPLGGYVKMFGHDYEQDVEEKEKPFAFLHKKLWQKTAIVLAGPLMNFFLAILIFAGLSTWVGTPILEPVLGEIKPLSPAGQAGFLKGDKILSINGKIIATKKETEAFLAQNPQSLLQVEVQNQEGEKKIRTVHTSIGEVPGKWGFLEKGGKIEGLNFFKLSAIAGIADPESIAGKAGLKTFDVVQKIEATKIRDLPHFLSVLKKHVQKESITIKVLREKKPLVFQLQPKNKPLDKLSDWGFLPSTLFIADLKKGGAAIKAGLQKGDFFLKINDQPITSWEFLTEKIKTFDESQKHLKLQIQREGKIKTLFLIPEKQTQIINGIEQSQYMVGIVASNAYIPAGNTSVLKSKGPISALNKGFNKTLYWCAVTGIYIKKFILGQVSRKTLGGPISIGRVAYDSYSYGLTYFFNIMAILSIQLFLLNILPIPIFDGGHLLFYLIEAIKGSPINIKKLIIAQKAGLLFLLLLLVFTTFNDLHNWFFIW